jgi:hypothetical protein
MSGKSSGAPDQTVLADIRKMIATPKTWVAAGEMTWIDAGGRPPGFTFRERLALPDGAQPASLFVECYFKAADVPGGADKVSLSLCFNHSRVLAIDENGVGGHYNNVGKGRPYFGQRIGFPHLHSVSDDCIYGYAEPLTPMSLSGYWEHFLACAGIVYAPPFQLPPMQFGLPV